MSILGLHHITMIGALAPRTVDFYTSVLGLRLVKKTVNFDDPESYHLYFGDGIGRPGTLLTFFVWGYHRPGQARGTRGQWGIGTTHHLALLVESEDAQLRWKRWLTDHGVLVSGPYDRRYFRSIYFTDPDGIILEIATRGSGFAVDEEADELGTNFIWPPRNLTRDGRDEVKIAAFTWPEPINSLSEDMRLRGLHHITAIASDVERTAAFFTETLGLRLVKKTLNFDDPTASHWYFGVNDGSPGTVVTYFGYEGKKMQRGRMGTGLTHHFAFAVENNEAQVQWRERLLSQGVQVTPVLDRIYFKSIYFSDPDGHILEIATTGPGFLVDEEEKMPGTRLALPDWLEGKHSKIEASLTPLEALQP